MVTRHGCYAKMLLGLLCYYREECLESKLKCPSLGYVMYQIKKRSIESNFNKPLLYLIS
jgi:hypothetical protein